MKKNQTMLTTWACNMFTKALHTCRYLVLKFSVTSEQGDLHFHFAMGSGTYITNPECIVFLNFMKIKIINVY